MGPGKGVNANRLAKVGLGEGSLDLGLCLVGGPISMPPKPLGDTGRIVATLISVAERVRERNKDSLAKRVHCPCSQQAASGWERPPLMSPD